MTQHRHRGEGRRGDNGRRGGPGAGAARSGARPASRCLLGAGPPRADAPWRRPGCSTPGGVSGGRAEGGAWLIGGGAGQRAGPEGRGRALGSAGLGGRRAAAGPGPCVGPGPCIRPAPRASGRGSPTGIAPNGVPKAHVALPGSSGPGSVTPPEPRPRRAVAAVQAQ